MVRRRDRADTSCPSAVTRTGIAGVGDYFEFVNRYEGPSRSVACDGFGLIGFVHHTELGDPYGSGC